MAQQTAITTRIIDTSYLLELFKVSGFHKAAHSKAIREKFRQAIENGDRLIVPIPCLFELGNHIADVKNGEKRLILADELRETLQQCIQHGRPWVITPSVSLDDLLPFFKSFADGLIVQKVGLTDTFIVRTAAETKKKYRRLALVHIWTKDKRLKAREPDPFLG